MFFLPIFGGTLLADVHGFPLGVVLISVCAVGVIRDKCVTSGVCRVIKNRVEDDDVTIMVFVAGTTSLDVTFQVSVIDVVTMDDNVICGGVEVLEVRTCGDVYSSGICVARVV